MKRNPDDVNEVHDSRTHSDPANVIVTLVSQLDPHIAHGWTHALKAKVQQMHANPENKVPNSRGNIRAQAFEEGEVAMAVEPGKAFPPDLYIMDFYDARTKEICSRMHKHTGQRFVLICTGPDTVVKTSSWSPMDIRDTNQKAVVGTLPDEDGNISHTFEVQPNSIVAVQIPTGVSHQFNAVGPNAVIISTHIEEMTEVDRERMTRPNMVAQTVFLQSLQPDLEKCGVPKDVRKKIESTLYQFLLKQNAHGYISAIQVSERLRAEGTVISPHYIHAAIREMYDEKHPLVKELPTIGSAVTVLIHESALDDLKKKLNQQIRSQRF